MVSVAITTPEMGFCSGTASFAQRASGFSKRGNSDRKEDPYPRENTIGLTSPPSRPSESYHYQAALNASALNIRSDQFHRLGSVQVSARPSGDRR
jgi:hypothetical protein